MFLENIQSITLILEYIAKINKLMSHKLSLTSQIWVLDNLSSIFKPNRPKYGF
jgi:hypothetical protein